MKPPEKCARPGGSCAAIQANTSVYSEVESMFDQVRDEFGRLDALVNNAGITRDALLHKMTEEQWRQVIEVNLTGVFFCLQAGARIMRDAGHGSIINISSDFRFGNVGQANYSASKAGVIGLTRTAARELARKNVRVNAISPGPIDTEMLQRVPDEMRQKLLAGVPLGRAGTVDELSQLILFLASERSSYLTGQVINCDGGWFMS
ncbi:MAG: SDR family oxidoreductase [Deltaproteobacteria bacterium]